MMVDDGLPLAYAGDLVALAGNYIDLAKIKTGTARFYPREQLVRKLRLYKKNVNRFVSINVPYPIAYCLSAAWENYSVRTHGQLPPTFNRLRCAAEWKGNRYSNAKLKQWLGWQPKVTFDEGSRLLFDWLRGVH